MSKKRLNSVLIKRSMFIYCLVVLIVISGLQAESKNSNSLIKKDISYSADFKRCTLDFYKAKSNKPTPLIIYFHGGGFKGGDKKSINKLPLLSTYNTKGVSFVACNYPLLGKQVGANDYLKIMSYCFKSVEYIESHYKDWNVDPQQVSMYGGSAGALIIEYLTYKNKFKCKSLLALQQPKGTDYFATPHMYKGAVPIMLYTTSTGGVHDPKYAQEVADRAKELSIEYKIYGKEGTKLPSLPKGKKWHVVIMDFFKKSWKQDLSSVVDLIKKLDFEAAIKVGEALPKSEQAGYKLLLPEIEEGFLSLVKDLNKHINKTDDKDRILSYIKLEKIAKIKKVKAAKSAMNSIKSIKKEKTLHLEIKARDAYEKLMRVLEKGRSGKPYSKKATLSKYKTYLRKYQKTYYGNVVQHLF